MKKEKMTVLHAAAERQIRGAARKSIESERQKSGLHSLNTTLTGGKTAAPKIDLTNITNKDAKRFTFFEKKFIISS